MMHDKPRKLWGGALLACLAVAALALPAHAGGRVFLGIGVPVYPAPVVVAPAPPVVVAPPPTVIYPAPVVVGPPPVMYGPAPVVVGGSYSPYYQPWRPSYHEHRW
jgi:hypothetical protein